MMNWIVTLVEFAFIGISAPAALILTLNRVGLGLAFGLSGFHKTFYPTRNASLRETLEYAGIPAVWCMTWIVCIAEFLFGLALVFGVASGLSALAVTVISIVAIVTVEAIELAKMPRTTAMDWIGNAFWVPAILFVFMGLVVMFVGPGWGFDGMLVEYMKASLL